MNMLRRIATASLLSLFTTTLAMFGMLLSLWIVFNDGDNLKTAMSQSGIYRELPRDALEQEQSKQETTSVPVSRPEIQAVVERSFPAAQLESDANQVIDGFYDWMKGKTAQPDFRVDISASKQALASGIADYTQQRLQSLPVCTVPVVGDVDVFTAECLPAGFNIASASQQVKRDVLGAGGPLKEPVLTAQTLKDDQGRTLAEQFNNLPQLYLNMKAALYALGVLIVVLAAGAIALHKSKREGMRRIAVAMVTVGVLSALVAWFGVALLKTAIGQVATEAQQNTLLQEKIGMIFQLLADQVRDVWLLFAIVVTIIGGLLLLGLRLWRRAPSASVQPPPVPPRPPVAK